MRLYGSLTELVNLVFRTGAGLQQTLRPNASTTLTADRTLDLPPGDSSQILVSATSAQTLTNKSLTAPVVTNYTDVTQTTAPATPGAGTNRYYVDSTDGFLHVVTPAGTNSPVGGGLTPVANSGALTALASNHYLTDTRSAAYTITLPTGATGAVIRFSDTYDNWAVNNLTIAPASGQTIDGLATNETLVCDVRSGWVELSWNGSIWSFQSLASPGPVVNASTTQAGLVSTGTQSFSGSKTFTGAVTTQGLLAPTSGIVGSTTGVAVSVGNVGETILASRVASVATPLTTNVAANICSITLTPGVWSISAMGGFSCTSAALSLAQVSVSKTSGTASAADTLAVPTAGEVRARFVPVTGSTSTDFVGPLSSYTTLVTTSTTFYLVLTAGFSSGSISGLGSIQAIRIS